MVGITVSRSGLVLMAVGAAILSMSSVPEACAVSTYWQAGTGDWNTPSNWTEGVPDAGDAAFISNSGTANITSAAGSCLQLTLGAGSGESGTVDMSGGSLTVNEYMYIGDEGTGLLNIHDGAVLTDSEDITGIFIGYQATGDGSVVISGAGSLWSRPWGLEMRVGQGGLGSVLVQDGGEISGGSASIGTGATGDGTVTITGSGSSWSNGGLWVAELGVGEVFIEDGATVSTVYTEIGGVTGGNGSVTVSGSGTTLDHSQHLQIGGESIGSLTIAEGAEVSADWSSGIGGSNVAVGTVTMMGEGSSLICQEDFVVGLGGTGTFTQTGGTSAIANNLYIGYSAGSNGAFTISDGVLDVSSLFVGLDGEGALDISGVGAEIYVSELLSFGPSSAITAVLGASVHMTGTDFENLSIDEAALAGLGNLELIFEGGGGDPDTVEVACVDHGPVADGFINNFALGKLTVGGGDIAMVRLVDVADNGNHGGTGGDAEALYVERLELGAGAVLDLNHLHLYWRMAFIDHGGTILNGEVVQVEPSEGDWWPMFHHDLSNTGFSTSSAPSTNDVAWTHNTAEGMDSSPAVVDGFVYIGSNDGEVYCLDGFTGEVVWTFTTGDEVNSSPAVANGMVYVGSDDYSIYCLPQFDPIPDGVIEPDEVIWTFPTGHKVSTGPAVVDDRVYVGSIDNSMYCLDALTGDYVWSYPTDGYITSDPAVADGKVYVGSQDGKVYSLDAATGDFIWSFTTGSYVEGAPAVAYGSVYVGSFDDRIYCLPQDDPNGDGNIDPGEVVWSYQAGDWIGSCPAVANGRVYIGSRDYHVYCLDAFDGGYIWDYETDFAVYSSAAVADGKVYIGTNAGTVYCLDELDGSVIWSYPAGGSVYSSPAVAAGLVYVGARNVGIHAFGQGLCGVSPTTLDFGIVDIGEYEDASFTITSTADATLTGSVSESCDHYSIIDGEGPYSIPPGDSLVVTVRFEPTSYGQHECTVETGHTACAEVTCTGFGGGYDPVPDPDSSFVEWRDRVHGPADVRPVVCPCGETSWLSVIVRDQYNAPMDGVEVTPTYEASCGMCQCEPLSAFTDSNGVAELHIQAGLDVSGDTDCCVVRSTVECMGVTIPWYGTGGAETDTSRWISPDLTGDCVVADADSVIVMLDYLGTACRTDFNCDGQVAFDDLIFFMYHYHHICGPIESIDDPHHGPADVDVLAQSAPNPFGLSTRIAFSLSKPGKVVLRICDVAGRHVRTLVDGHWDAREHEVVWDGRDDQGKLVAPGIYFSVLDAPGYSGRRKIVHIK